LIHLQKRRVLEYIYCCHAPCFLDKRYQFTMFRLVFSRSECDTLWTLQFWN